MRRGSHPQSANVCTNNVDGQTLAVKTHTTTSPVLFLAQPAATLGPGCLHSLTGPGKPASLLGREVVLDRGKSGEVAVVHWLFGCAVPALRQSESASSGVWSEIRYEADALLAD